jgi:hypothetical protein
MASTSVVMVTARKNEGGNAICEAVAERRTEGGQQVDKQKHVGNKTRSTAVIDPFFATDI